MDRTPIYILGIGNLGKLVAHSLRKQSPATPVTLLLHRESLLSDWAAAGQAIECGTPGGGHGDRRTGFAVEALPPGPHSRHPTSCAPPPGAPATIKNLVVATKTYATAAALGPIKHRLGRDSNVLFLQNGMGAPEELSAALFADPKSRPAYWAGICSAGVYATGPFSIVHAGRGPLTIGRVFLDDDDDNDDADRDQQQQQPPTIDGKSGSNVTMIQRLLEAQDLNASLATPRKLRAAQLQKLVVNATINPLTAILDCRNGDVFATPARLELLRLLIAETGPVVRALLARPRDPAAEDAGADQLSDERLLAGARLVAERTGANTSSMLQDLRAGRETEVDHINGYVVAQARRLGLSAPRNAALVEMLKRREHVADGDVLCRFAS